MKPRRFKNQALGRLKAGQMNKTEAAYAARLKCLQERGDVLWYRFEPITLHLAKNTSYRPDFLVMAKDRGLELHEVKGSRHIFQDDARVKVKVTAETFPFRMLVVYPRKQADGGGWELEEY